MTRSLLRLRFHARAVVSREPGLAPLYWLVIRWTQHRMSGAIDPRECRVGPETEILIDGFPGSGNSFATVAFKISQERPVMLAHHLHAPAQIIKAVKRGVPTLVTIREPGGAAISLTSRWPYVPVRLALGLYIRFYEKIAPYADGFVLSAFDSTTREIDAVFREVNRRFGSDFTVFEYSDANMKKLRDPENLRSDRIVRQSIKREKANELRDTCQDLLPRAESVYNRLVPSSRILGTPGPREDENEKTTAREGGTG